MKSLFYSILTLLLVGCASVPNNPISVSRLSAMERAMTLLAAHRVDAGSQTSSLQVFYAFTFERPNGNRSRSGQVIPLLIWSEPGVCIPGGFNLETSSLEIGGRWKGDAINVSCRETTDSFSISIGGGQFWSFRLGKADQALRLEGSGIADTF